MKKFFASVAVTGLLLGATATSAFAAEDGAPGAHGLSGREWGAAVSGLAKSAPGAMGAHASGK